MTSISKVVPPGLGPRTLRLLAVRSNQLSYETFLFVQKPSASRWACREQATEIWALKKLRTSPLFRLGGLKFASSSRDLKKMR